MREENKIQIFKKEEFGEIRVLTINNEPWFVGKDVAEKLGYKNTKDALKKRVDDEDKEVILRSQIATLEIPNRGLTIINESGLYSLILSSKLPQAKKFKRWVTSEVLPNIRQNGGYINNADVFVNTYFNYLDDTTKDIVKGLCKNIEEQQKQITVLKPKAKGFDAFMNTENLIDFNVVAKNLGIGRNSMLEILRENRILIDGRYEDYNGNIKYKESHNTPYQRFSKYFTVKFIVDNKNKRHTTTYVTSEGQEYIRKKLISLGYINNVA